MLIQYRGKKKDFFHPPFLSSTNVRIILVNNIPSRNYQHKPPIVVTNLFVGFLLTWLNVWTFFSTRGLLVQLHFWMPWWVTLELWCNWGRRLILTIHFKLRTSMILLVEETAFTKSPIASDPKDNVYIRTRFRYQYPEYVTSFYYLSIKVVFWSSICG